jgi:hypothetical protein
LQLLFGGFQFFVGGLNFFVGGNKLLVSGIALFNRGPQIKLGYREVVSGRGEAVVFRRADEFVN